MTSAPDRVFQVTTWDDPEDQIKSQWGTVRWGTWLLLESQRWQGHGRFCEIKTENGMQALFARTGAGWMPAETGEE